MIEGLEKRFSKLEASLGEAQGDRMLGTGFSTTFSQEKIFLGKNCMNMLIRGERFGADVEWRIHRGGCG
jgi:hypothetical protein